MATPVGAARNQREHWQRRRYFPKGTDLSVHSAADLDGVAAELNDQPCARLVSASRSPSATVCSGMAPRRHPRPKLRAVYAVKPLLSRGFVVFGVGCSGYFRVSGIGASRSSNADRKSTRLNSSHANIPY